jgi:DNA invertase Pin-like site-specific DNA recombinase
MRAAIYARVSKETCTVKACGHLKTDHAGAGCCQRAGCACSRYEGQDAENQLLELRRYAHAQRWESLEYIDYETGKHSDRDAFRALFVDASRRRFDVVLVWALDRLSREGILSTLQHLKRLKEYGVGFESYSEAWARSTGPLGELFVELMTAVTAWAAQQERVRISERTKAGLARARAAGRVGGRRATVFDRAKARKLRDSGLSWRKVAGKMGVSQTTLRDALRRPK